jgi:hypothetical protein
MAAIARNNNNPEGFAYFYRLLFGRPLPRHALEEWVKPIYAAAGQGQGIVIEAFRGSTKTTTTTITTIAFRIGHAPQKSNLIVQVSDEIAKDNAQHIADLIAYNPAWCLVFPHVSPDFAAGWGANGYEVKRTDMDYAQWRRLCAVSKGKDPSFIGLGYRSRAIIGKHPTGMLVIDDIHDENNTRSARELQTTVKVVTGTILPTTTPQTLIIFIGTPWTKNDVLDYAKSTGRFQAVRTPVLRDEKPVWPEVYNKREIEKQRKLAGEIEFSRMFMLDLEAAAGMHLKRDWLHAYPLAKIDPGWPVVMGVDYASTADQSAGGKRDYYAVAIGRVLPGGAGVVLVDGFRAKVSQGEAEQRLKALAAIYPTTQLIGVEAVGKGEEFYHLLLRTSLLPLMPFQPGGRSKGQRFERAMAPLFQFNRAWVADVDTPFLRAFRDEWLRWPYGDHDDTLDAVYWMLRAGLPHLLGPTQKGRKQTANPFRVLGRN